MYQPISLLFFSKYMFILHIYIVNSNGKKHLQEVENIKNIKFTFIYREKYTMQKTKKKKINAQVILKRE